MGASAPPRLTRRSTFGRQSESSERQRLCILVARPVAVCAAAGYDQGLPLENAARGYSAVRAIARVCLVIASAAALLAAGTGVLAGNDRPCWAAHHHVAPCESSRDIATAMFVVYTLANGSKRSLADMCALHEASRRLLGTLGGIEDRWIAGVLAAAIFVVGLMYATTAASGSDTSGYVSYAELLLQGRIEVAEPWVRDVPWPNALWTFAPLGYHPPPGHESADALVPMYAPGLPMLLALSKAIGGQAAMFGLVPLAGALLVLATFGIGRRLGSSAPGSSARGSSARVPPCCSCSWRR